MENHYGLKIQKITFQCYMILVLICVLEDSTMDSHQLHVINYYVNIKYQIKIVEISILMKNIQNIQTIQVVMKVPGSIPGGRLITSTSAPATGTAISPLG